MLQEKSFHSRSELRSGIGHEGAWVCIECGSALERSANVDLVCPTSSRRYPIVAGVPILTENPDLLIRAFAESWADACALVEQQAADLPRLRASGVRAGWLERATRQARGRSENIAMLQKYLAPLTAYLDADRARLSGSAALLHAYGAGWSLEAMLPYFVQDWSESPDFASVRALLVANLVQYVPDRSCVSVLGAGACGVARAAAELFDQTFAVDLSLPTLLLARGLLAGDHVTAHLQQLGWMPVTLRPPAPARKPVIPVVSDVNRLPFADGTVSAVITQYLLDLMNDPLATARELRRVLKPGGIWVNFSNPVQFVEEASRFGAPDSDEMPPLFAPLGFETLQCKRERFTLLNFDHLGGGGQAFRQDVHHFVMAKRSDAGGGPAKARSWSCAADDLWWEQAVHRVPHRIVETARKTAFDVSGTRQRVEIGVSGDLVAGEEASVEFFEFLMKQIDAHQRLRDIYDKVNAFAPISRDEFKAMLSTLERRFGVVAFEV